MPELPEVETMVRGLRHALVGRTLRAVEVIDEFLLEGCDAAEFGRRSVGSAVEAVGRRGKWVVIVLGQRRGLIVIQPRMSGGFRHDAEGVPSHPRLAFRLAGPRGVVWYCDARRLGKIAWYATADDAERAFARSHGPDALVIGRDDLAARLARTSRGIKPTLLDQKVLAGVGNIYADEILFVARIHPERPASALTPGEIGRLHESIGRVLNTAVELEGSSFDGNYRTLLGREGGYLKQGWVHLRRGEPCRVCATPVVKTKINGLVGRPTYLCPTCQPAAVARRGPSGRGGRDRVR